MSTIPQLPTLKARLQQLNLKKAQYGISADPHIQMEAQDIETLIGLMDRIDIHRRNLDHLLKQRGTFGANTPMHIASQIENIRAEIVNLRRACERSGQSVPPHPLDSDDQPELPPITPRQPARTKDELNALLDEAFQILADIRAIVREMP